MRPSRSRMTVRVMTRLALLGAVALALGWVESFFPMGNGIKLGLANTVLLYALYLLNIPAAVILMILKVGLSVLTPAGAAGVLYSAAGAVVSLAMMILVKTVSRDKVSIIGVSVVGAVFHNVGQLLMAGLVLGAKPMLVYAPVLLLSGVIMGSVTGTVGRYAVRALERVEGAGGGRGRSDPPEEPK